MKKLVLLFTFAIQTAMMNAQTKCDSIRFYPDTYYLTQWEDMAFYDSMSYFGDNFLDYALGEYRLEDNQHITLDGTFATHGVTGPYEFKDVLGININYLQFVTPPDTEVEGFRIISHWSMQGVCEFPVTFIINPSVAGNNKAEETTMQVYPNPAQDEVNILTEKSFTGEVIVTAINGLIVKKLTVNNSDKIKINSSELIPGNYLINLIENGNKIGIQKLTILR